MELITIVGKVVAKNRAFANSIIFLQQIFQFRGGVCPAPLGGALVNQVKTLRTYSFYCSTFQPRWMDQPRWTQAAVIQIINMRCHKSI